MPINQPSNQIKFTNLAIVRMKKNKKRFEIACYKNKVLDWRSEAEKDITNVLQSEDIYLSVNKGQHASKADLRKAWPDMDTKAILMDILNNGDVQVGEKERHAELDRLKQEVIAMVASRLVEPTEKRVYTTGMIEKALDQLSSQSASQQAEKANDTATESGETEEVKTLPRWTGVVFRKEMKTEEEKLQDAKSQALFAMKCLVAHQPMPLARMQMKLRITCPSSILKQAVKSAPKNQRQKGEGNGEEKAHGTVKDAILGYLAQLDSQDTMGAEWEAIGLVEPGNYKTLNEFINSHTKGRGSVEVLDKAVGVDL